MPQSTAVVEAEGEQEYYVKLRTLESRVSGVGLPRGRLSSKHAPIKEGLGAAGRSTYENEGGVQFKLR